jgi:hypothetical protein
MQVWLGCKAALVDQCAGFVKLLTKAACWALVLVSQLGQYVHSLQGLPAGGRRCAASCCRSCPWAHPTQLAVPTSVV